MEELQRKNPRSFYSSTICEFLSQELHSILGNIQHNNYSSETLIQQSNTWEAEIAILKNQLKDIKEGRIIFEYTIPRMGKRVDVILLHQNIVFLLEFKCGDKEYRSSADDQVYDYALDLRNFQKESHDKLLAAITVSTEASNKPIKVTEKNRIIEPIRCNKSNIITAIQTVVSQYKEPAFDYKAWEDSAYFPTPTIVEAAQALYRNHNVHEITRSDAGAENLTVTTNEINKIIEYSKANKKKSICFVTGVPGAGKTLAGLNIAIERSNAQEGEHAVFLSGNFPLVQVLQEALARDKVEQARLKGDRISKKEALRETSLFIQIIHRYRSAYVNNSKTPPERVAIFDEAQRSWTQEMLDKFMKTKKGIPNFGHSEPEFLIGTMDRHDDWAVIICLVGGGQEINTGEAGLPEWFNSLRKTFKHWDVYITPQLDDAEYRRDRKWEDMISNLNVTCNDKLHLATSIRSFRTPDLAAFVKALLDVDTENARKLHQKIKDKYPIMLTRDLNKAKEWVKEQSQGTTRYGLLASSGGLRLKPEGVFVKNEISVANWFLNGKDDVRSSYALEDVVTEFDIQGLELDYSILAWDADFRFDGLQWSYNNFSGSKWNKVKNQEKQLYLKNTYRVLLTRARQGMVIFIPKGDHHDQTRKPLFYDLTFDYLKSLGLQII
ncbi:MAG: DUF2075 domain-containing protein [Bacillota bacterium]|nr:DUF2075 domain-containing protein [Bacillota bacterium]